MALEKTNSEYRLYHLISNLTPSEKKQVHSFFKTDEKGNKKSSHLYSLALKAKSYATFKKALQSQKSTKALSRYLSEKIIEILALGESSKSMAISFIDMAIQKGLLGLAKSKIRSLVKGEDFEYSPHFQKSLWDKARELDKIYGVQVDEFTDREQYLCILEECRLCSTFDSLAEKYRQGLKLSPDTRMEIFRSPSSFPQLKPEIPYLPETNLKHAIARRNFNLLGSDLGGAFRNQVSIIELIKNRNGSVSEGVMLKERFRLVSMMVAFNQFNEARTELFDLGASELENEYLERIQIENWIKYSILLSACSGNIDVSDRIVRDFERNVDLFSAKWKGLIYIAIIVIQIHKWDLENAVIWSVRLQRLKTETIIPVNWIPPASRFIAYYEQGDFKLAEAQIVDLVSVNEDSPNAYVDFLIQAFSTALAFGSSELPPQTISRLKSQLSDIQLNPAAKAFSNYFNIGFWLQAKEAKMEVPQWLKVSEVVNIFSFSAVS